MCDNGADLVRLAWRNVSRVPAVASTVRRVPRLQHRSACVEDEERSVGSATTAYVSRYYVLRADCDSSAMTPPPQDYCMLRYYDPEYLRA